MQFGSSYGDVQVKVVRWHSPEFLLKNNEYAQNDAFSASENECRPFLDIVLWTMGGGVYLSLPRYFHGLITIQPSSDRVNLENISLSRALEERAAPLSDVNGARAYFIGDRPDAWMSWCDDNNQEGDVPERPFDTLTVSHWSSALRIRWDGELEPAFPE